MKNIIYRLSLILFLLILFICISAFSYANIISNNISDSVFRLHVIANSDSDIDQDLKYKIRDSLIDYMNSLIPKNSSKQEIIEIANNHINDFYAVAQNTMKNEGVNYPINISIEKTDFPTKKYGDVTFPAGTYDALKVKIGSAEGQNWWCVMFPPLCFVDVSSGVVPDDSKGLLKETLNEEEYALITPEHSSDITIKFKLIEFIENLK